MGAPEVQTITKIFYLKYASVGSSSILNEKTIKIIPTSGSGATSTESPALGGASKETCITKVVEKILSANGKIVEDPRTNSLIIIDVPSRMPVIEQVIASLDVRRPQVLLEVEMLDVEKSATDKIGIKFSTPVFDQTFTPGGASWNSKWPTGSLLGDVTKNFAGGTFTVTNNTGYRMIVDFLKTMATTRYLARPRILTLNHETAEISISSNEAVGTITVTQLQNQQSTTSAERYGTGVILRVTPQINLDTNEITMLVIPAVAETQTSNVTGYRDPETRYTRSMVVVKDGETIVIGGLMRRNSLETVTKLPFFGDLPIIGNLFRHRYREKDKDRELLVFITPHIIKDTGVQLAQAKKGALPEREQSTASRVDRQAAIDASLKSFEKKKK
jgi:type II secretory pathway component GspD/PulD (secretin)